MNLNSPLPGEKPTLHVVNLPHTQVTKAYNACAYTSKCLKFCDMMSDIGYNVILYAGEETDTNDKVELVTIFTKEDQHRWFGDFDFHKDFFPITWDPNDAHWQESNLSACREINKRLRATDLICIIAGNCHGYIYNSFNQIVPVIEYGIGYKGTISKFKVFESYSHMHWVYGKRPNDNGNGEYYDVVIPNYFDVDEFYVSQQKGDYHLFLGRFMPRKGVEIAVEITRRLGKKLIMAGQGCHQEGQVFSDIDGWKVIGDHIEHIGHVNIQERADLLSKAEVTYMPTIYIEPFGGVSVESLLSGTPVIASDFGAFTEQINHGFNGYRFRTIGEATFYGQNLDALDWDSNQIREDAVRRYSKETAALMYDNYFMQVLGQKNGRGFYGDWHGSLDRYAYPSSLTRS